MPRNVRNFWIEVYVDGKKTEFKSGPTRKDGGMFIRIYQRSQGVVKKVAEICCVAKDGDILETSIGSGHNDRHTFCRTVR